MGIRHSNTTQLQNLLDQAACGDDLAYDEVINIAAARLQKLTGKMLQSYPHLRRWEETSDVFQTAVVRLHRSLSAVQPDSVRGFFGLAATQIRRTLIDLARHHFGPLGQAAKHHSSAGEASDGDGILVQQVGDSASPETLDSWASFHEAVEHLPASEREVFELVWYGGLAQREIGDLLGASIPTVKRRFRSARVQLYESLRGENPFDVGG